MIDSDDFSSHSYNYSMGCTSNTMSNNGYLPSNNNMDLGSDNDKKKKSFEIDVNCRQQQQQQSTFEITRRDIKGRSLLHYFAFNGDIESAKKLFISFSFPVDLTDDSLNTPLHVASEFGQSKIAILLLEQQALINRQNLKGKTALHLAVEGEQREIAEILLSSGANPNIVDLEGASPLHYSVANGFLEISQSLLRHGAFVNIKDYSKETPMFWAIRESKVDQVELLIKNGANVNAKNDDGETPLELAQEFDEDDIAILIQKALNPSPYFVPSSNINLPMKSQPVNFVFPKGMEEQPIIENRPQSL